MNKKTEDFLLSLSKKHTEEEPKYKWRPVAKDVTVKESFWDKLLKWLKLK